MKLQEYRDLLAEGDDSLHWTEDHEYKDLFNEALDYIDTLEFLLENREQVLHAVPECPAHGGNCVPHALEWIERRKNKEQ